MVVEQVLEEVLRHAEDQRAAMPLDKGQKKQTQIVLRIPQCNLPF